MEKVIEKIPNPQTTQQRIIFVIILLIGLIIWFIIQPLVWEFIDWIKEIAGGAPL